MCVSGIHSVQNADFLAFVVLSGFANKTITGQTCLYVGLGLAAIVLVQMLVHYLSDSLQSAAGYLMFADKRIELGGHLRKLPMGYFTSGNIGKISSVLSTDMVFIEEVAMSTLGNMMSYLLSSLVLLAFMFYLNWQLGLIAAIVTILAWLVSKGMNKVSLREAAGRQEQSERLTDAVLSFVEGIGVIKSYNLLGENPKNCPAISSVPEIHRLTLNENDPVDNGAEYPLRYWYCGNFRPVYCVGTERCAFFGLCVGCSAICI